MGTPCRHRGRDSQNHPFEMSGNYARIVPLHWGIRIIWEGAPLAGGAYATLAPMNKLRGVYTKEALLQACPELRVYAEWRFYELSVLLFDLPPEAQVQTHSSLVQTHCPCSIHWVPSCQTIVNPKLLLLRQQGGARCFCTELMERSGTHSSLPEPPFITLATRSDIWCTLLRCTRCGRFVEEYRTQTELQGAGLPVRRFVGIDDLKERWSIWRAEEVL